MTAHANGSRLDIDDLIRKKSYTLLLESTSTTNHAAPLLHQNGFAFPTLVGSPSSYKYKPSLNDLVSVLRSTPILVLPDSHTLSHLKDSIPDDEKKRCSEWAVHVFMITIRLIANSGVAFVNIGLSLSS